MDKKLLKVLKKLYVYNNYVYDIERSISLYREDTLEQAERELLQAHQWHPNQVEYIGHDQINRKLIALQKDERLSWPRIAAQFVAGVGGSFPRGISGLMSYHLMIHTQEHAYEQAQRFISCKFCGFHKDQWEHVSWIRYVMFLGNTYGSAPEGAYIDLTELVELAPVVPTNEDIAVFQKLLLTLDQADDGETPGQLEKRLTALKLVKGSTGIRRGILQSLAMVGVLPNTVVPLGPEQRCSKEELNEAELTLGNTKGRSDMELPWAGWNGRLGVDWEKAAQLFGDYCTRQE